MKKKNLFEKFIWILGVTAFVISLLLAVDVMFHRSTFAKDCNIACLEEGASEAKIVRYRCFCVLSGVPTWEIPQEDF